jgi:hypothetical protein
VSQCHHAQSCPDYALMTAPATMGRTGPQEATGSTLRQPRVSVHCQAKAPTLDPQPGWFPAAVGYQRARTRGCRTALRKARVGRGNPGPNVGELLAAPALPGNPDGCTDPANHHVVATNRIRGWRRGFAAANPYIHFANCGGCGENVVAPAASGRLSPERRGSVKGMRLTAVRRGRQPRHVVPRIGWVRSQAKLAAYYCLPPN